MASVTNEAMNLPLVRNPGKVWSHETHFFYPFILTKIGAEGLDVPYIGSTEGETLGAKVGPWIWGNGDEHLTTNLCVRSEQVLTDDRGRWAQGSTAVAKAADEQSSKKARRRSSVRQIKRLNTLAQSFASSGAVHMSETLSEKSNICRLEDVKGNRYRICECYVRVFAFNLAVLRFAVTAENNKGPPTLADILAVQDVIQHIQTNKASRRRSSVAKDTNSHSSKPQLKLFNFRTGQAMGDFNTSVFMKGILDCFVGKSAGEIMDPVTNGPMFPPLFVEEHEAMWKPDKFTDQLFTFSMLGIEGLGPLEAYQEAVYRIGRGHSSVETRLSKKSIKAWLKNNAVGDQANEVGKGMWQTFSGGSAASIYMAPSTSCPQLPFRIEFRKKYDSDMAIMPDGTRRPLAAFSLCEIMMLKRTFLRGVDFDLKELVNMSTSKQESKTLRALQTIYSKLVWFRANLGGSFVASTSETVQEYYIKWAEVTDMQSKESSILAIVKDVHDMLGNAQQESNRRRLDALTVCLSFIGIAALANDIFTNWMSSDVNIDKGEVVRGDDYAIIYIPAGFTLLLFIVAVFVLKWLFRREMNTE